jgi:hypothetical protein
MSVRLSSHQAGSVTLIRCKALRKVDCVFLFFYPSTNTYSALETFCCDKKEMCKFKIYVLFSSVAVFHLFSFSILYWDCTVM